MFYLLTATVRQALVALGWALSGRTGAYESYARSAAAFETPIGILAAHLGLATLIPLAMGLMVAVHRASPRWLLSVEFRVRWRYLLACLGLAVFALVGVLWVSTLFGAPFVLNPQPGFWAFLVVIVLTSPIQATAEELFFRGYLTQALGSLFAHPLFGVVLSSAVFALFHGTQNLPLFANRFAFGLLAALLVWRTGGLEAGIAAHVVNNVVAYLLAGLTSSVAALKAIQSLEWTDAAFDIGSFALFAVLAWLLARRLRLRTTVDLPTLHSH